MSHYQNDRLWESNIKLPGKSKRRRVLERITRFASSPSLSKDTLQPVRQDDSKAPMQSVSCISLSSAATSDAGILTPRLEGGFQPSPRPETAPASGLTSDTWESHQIGQARPPREALQWQQLPDEVKMQILKWLDPMELVRCSSISKEWRSLCYDGQLWKTLDASEFYNRIPVDQLAGLITSTGSFVRHLNIRGCVQLQQDWRLEAVANACRNLLSASLEGCRLERSFVDVIVLRNPRMVHLNLSGLDTVTNHTCRMIAQSCPQIETLNLAFCTSADGRGLRRVVDGCKELRELRACQMVINDLELMQTLFRSNNMEKLHFGDCSGITDELLRVMLEGVEPDIDPFTNRTTAPPRKLVHLDLNKCHRLTDSTLRHLSGNVPELQGLELGGIPGLSDSGFATLLPTLPHLTHLDIEECPALTNTTLLNIARSPAARKMVHLQVSYCENLGDAGMIEVLRKCERLRNLEMDNTRVSDLTLAEAAHVIGQRFANPARRITNSPASRVALRLVVFDCSNITWTGIREILSRNTETIDPAPTNAKPHLIQLKCFYEYQRTVDEHMKLVLRKDAAKANLLENKWAEFMMANEEAGAGGRRRRRRQREVVWGDGGDGIAMGMAFGSRRSRRVGCSIM